METALQTVTRTELVPYDNIIGEIVEKFITAQDVKPSSRALYRRTLNQFLIWVKERELPLKEITRAEIIEYKDALLGKGMSSLTVGSYITAVRKFYEWTEANKYYPNVARGIKAPRRKQDFRKQPLTIDQTTTLLTHFKEKSTEGLRDYAIVNLLLRTGLRTIEAVQANIEDITFKQGKRILMIQGKGEVEKNNFVILTDKAYEPIKAYLETRTHAKVSEPLFVSVSNNSHGLRLTTRTISKIVKEGLKSIGLDSKHLTAHSLRHTLAVNILKAGGSLQDAQGVLRHASPVTTQIYTRAIEEEMRIRNAPEELIEDLY
ncbi:MAG: Tyrosine recombinase XerD [Candidatus Aminicenantes bacterium ADurb.Bin508]|nr:MAG: Tyrosine recombinase XerD [Candidatus Aminicenantes bacterium ADurb.Bin508]